MVRIWLLLHYYFSIKIIFPSTLLIINTLFLRNNISCSDNLFLSDALLFSNFENPCKWHFHTTYRGSHSQNFAVKFTYAFICAATSAAKSSLFFSIPSPVSKRTKRLIEKAALFSFATCATYSPTVCLPSSAFT